MLVRECRAFVKSFFERSITKKKTHRKRKIIGPFNLPRPCKLILLPILLSLVSSIELSPWASSKDGEGQERYISFL
jgi:hypothetical protein